MLSVLRTVVILPALVVGLALSGCTPTPDPAESPSAEASPGDSASTSPSVAPSPELVLPDCDTMFSEERVAQLIAEGREPESSIASPPSGDSGVLAVFEGVTESAQCGWILPASESGSITTVAFIDEATSTEVQAALTAGGFTASTLLGGDAFSLETDSELSSISEFHLVVDGAWIFTLYFGGSAEALTVDAAEQLLP